MTWLLGNFQQFPNLTGSRTHSLFYFVRGKVGLKPIQALCSVCPTATSSLVDLMQTGSKRRLRVTYIPILEACRDREATDTVILFLASQVQRHSVADRLSVTHVARCALKSAMQRRNTSTEMLRILVAGWPHAAASSTVMAESLAKFPRRFSEFTFDSFPLNVHELRIQQPFSDSSHLELHQVKSICLALPQLKAISVCSGSGTTKPLSSFWNHSNSASRLKVSATLSAFCGGLQ